MLSIYRLRAPLWLAACLIATLPVGCAPSIEHRGYVAKPGAFDQITNGMPKSEVEAVLGSPSTTASVKFQGDSYYYITSTTKGRAFLQPTVVDRQVIAIRFDMNDQVVSFAQYGLEDGRVIDINSQTTPVAGGDVSIITRLLRGLTSSTGAVAGPD
jgi:outer membrane protein assembly factor BamE (lipoprotein component of BamABCDE complex)